MRGISARLDSPDARIRRHGQKVAVALSRVMSPDRPLTFDDAEDYGASETAGTVSEDEEAWERDAWRLKEGSVEEEEDAEADSFAASVLGPETPEDSPEDTPDTPEDDDDRREAEHDETDEDLEEDFDDPDGAVRLGGGARREDSSDDESDEDDASSEGSALEPYDISDEEESDEEEGDAEGGGGDRGTLVDPAVRRAKAVRATARRIARLPKPKTLSSCVDALRQARRADDSASSKSTIDRADEAEGAVHAAEATDPRGARRDHRVRARVGLRVVTRAPGDARLRTDGRGEDESVGSRRGDRSGSRGSRACHRGVYVGAVRRGAEAGGAGRGGGRGEGTRGAAPNRRP
jgi:hypothetical protein